MNTPNLMKYKVWDLPTRLFHWINFTAIIGLIFFGLIMLYKKELGITSVEAKIGLKEVHVIIGYIFVLNLGFRLLWGFIGNQHARWRAILPGKGFLQSVHGYKASLGTGSPQQFLGHNPLGRLAITVMLLLLIVMASTGLIRAGTDIYYPPFGAYVAEYVAAPDTDPASLVPYDPTGTNAEKADSLKAFKKPFGSIHLYTAFILMFIIVVHIAAVVYTEVREGGGIITAMFTGSKVLSGKPVDGDS
ncbi:MAG: cytochrome b/b6 domain-containing protein [Gammaproteobacteria bacterium]|nr:cytochrome b/b6 domain-containing protein [Gammaproteobacteria bacterium]